MAEPVLAPEPVPAAHSPATRSTPRRSRPCSLCGGDRQRAQTDLPGNCFQRTSRGRSSHRCRAAALFSAIARSLFIFAAYGERSFGFARLEAIYQIGVLLLTTRPWSIGKALRPAVEGEQLRPADQAAGLNRQIPEPDPAAASSAAASTSRLVAEGAPQPRSTSGTASAPTTAVQDLPRRRRRRLVGSPAAGQTGARSLRPVRPGALRRSIAVAASRPKWPACAITTD